MTVRGWLTAQRVTRTTALIASGAFLILYVSLVVTSSTGLQRRARDVMDAHTRGDYAAVVALVTDHLDSTRSFRADESSDLAELHYRRAVAYTLLPVPENELAIADFRTAVSLADHVPTYWAGLGLALQLEGRFQEALDSAGRALQLDPNSEVARQVWIYSSAVFETAE